MLSSAKRNCEMGINPQVLVDRTPYGTPWYLYIHQSTRTCQKTCLSVFPYIFQAKYVRNKKINENKLVGGITTWGTIWGPVYEHMCKKLELADNINVLPNESQLCYLVQNFIRITEDG